MALIAVVGVACTEKSGDGPTKPAPGVDGKHYVEAIETYMGDTTTEEAEKPFLHEAILFDLDSKNRITNTRCKEYNDANEVVDEYANIKFEYSDDSSSLTIKTVVEDYDVVVECDLNDRGAITTARWTSPVDLIGMVETFEYNDSGELVNYKLGYGARVGMSLDYVWENGNIVRITSEGVDDTFTYTAEPNPYNVDLFYAYAWNAPLLTKFIVIHDGILGNTNRSMLTGLKTTYDGEEIAEEIDHEFKDGLVEYTRYDDALLRYVCY